MLAWTGKGSLVPVLTYALLIAAEYGSEKWTEDDAYYQTHGWPILSAFVLSGLIVGYVTPVVFRDRRVVDIETGEELVVRETHTFMFVHLRYWGLLLPIIGAGFYLSIQNGGGG